MARSVPDEATLWGRARSGDAPARELLAELAAEVAGRELRRRGMSGADGDDLQQESVRSALAYLAGAGEAPRDLRAFLKFRTLGVLSDHRKKMRTSRVQLLPDDEVDAPSSEPGPEQHMRSLQLRAALDACRKSLGADQREVLRLRYEAREETEAIAAAQGVHRNTINVRVFRALESLRECMRRKGFEAGDLA